MKQEISVTLSKTDVPIGAALVCNFAKLRINWGEKTQLPLNSLVTLTSSSAISRHVARMYPSLDLYPSDILHRTEVDHWLTFSNGPLGIKKDILFLQQLNNALAPSQFVTAGKLTIADLELFGALHKSPEWQDMVAKKSCPPHVLRWYNDIRSKVDSILSSLPPEVQSAITVNIPANGDAPIKREEEGKYVDLPGAKMGEVVVRFPPEASGYLHIGHAKAALLNQYYQKAFKGKLVMRFDDTNPEKEKADFEKEIIHDVKLLEVEPDKFSFTSDYFDQMLEMCESLLKNGKAYVDDTDAETMKKERDERKESKNRNNSVEQNLKMWKEMKCGSEFGQKCCVRAKIDMNSPNGCLRDPTIYRCKNEPHLRTGNKFNVYPTYDFACPIVDSVEGITHVLRTTEYHDRDDQYFWFIENLGLRKMHLYEYSRLNMNNTVLSKRKLTWFVEQGIVDGWDDPRFPTVRGILRRGMTIEGLKDFIVAQGSSRSVVNMEWDKIWAFNKKVIDREAPRYTALQGDLIPVIVTGAQEELKEAQKHPKDPSKGMKSFYLGPKVFVEAVDAEQLKEGENATFINWGNLRILKVIRKDGKLERIEAEPNLSNTDFKKTLKLTWLAETSKAPWTPVVCSYFDHLITKNVLGKDEDFKSFVNKSTRNDVQMVGDHELRNLKVGDIIQIQRKGFFRVDNTYKTFSAASCKESPVVLFYIPDGHTKEPVVASAVKENMSEKEKKQSQKGKKIEKSPEDDSKSLSSDIKAAEIHQKIKEQGDKIRKLKSDKADKTVIMTEVDVLKALKVDFKTCTGVDWTPDLDISKFATSNVTKSSCPESNNVLDLHNKIKEQGDKIRLLKAEKADKTVIMTEVDVLKALKADFKTCTGVDWTPDLDISKFTTSNVTKSSCPVSSNVSDLHNKIKEQGDKIRLLKAEKADKTVIKPEVDTLLSLKNDFKAKTNIDWKPDLDINVLVTDSNSSKVNECKQTPEFISTKIKEQGDKVRTLKASHSSKETIKAEVDVLLSLKKDFKNLTGEDWKPDSAVSCEKPSQAPQVVKETVHGGISEAEDIHLKIKDQGNKVRSLKSAKADAETIKKEVNVLLDLKANFKNASGIEWKPDIDVSSLGKLQNSPSPSVASTTSNSQALEIHKKIKEQGDKVRSLKSQKAEKSVLSAEVEILLSLKKEFKILTNIDWKPDIDPSSLASANSHAKESVDLSPSTSKQVDSFKCAKKAKIEPKQPEDKLGKKQTRLGLEAKKKENLSDWYSQVLTKSEMIEYYNVSGCYILRPWSYSVWEIIKDFFDKEIKKLGVENGYFPIFVSKDSLEKEKTHIADFSPEVAWVTKSGSSDMAEPVAIRPTSETVMYPAYAKWIQSHRDLPLRINQWNNVVRWEFKQPTPFLRTREFLWQEGHTAFATKEEACKEVYIILELYARIYEELLAIPVVRGHKTKKEEFAGGDFTTTTEAYISASGRGIQGATSHHLGQNFSKMFEIVFDDPKTQEKKFVYQNSWGITTRTIGVMVMVHGDDKGLVLPPRVAPVQVVIMPVGITASTTDEVKQSLINYCTEVEKELTNKDIKTRCDLRDNVTPAWKFNHWELKGVPLRIEVGPRELAENKVFAVRRDTGEKQSLDKAFIERRIYNLLETIQKDMFDKAMEDLQTHKTQVNNWQSFLDNLDKGNIILAPSCGIEACEEEIKKTSAKEEPSEAGGPSMGAKGLCIPFEQPGKVDNLKCINPRCSNSPKFYTLFGRSY